MNIYRIFFNQPVYTEIRANSEKEARELFAIGEWEEAKPDNDAMTDTEPKSVSLEQRIRNTQ